MSRRKRASCAAAGADHALGRRGPARAGCGCRPGRRRRAGARGRGARAPTPTFTPSSRSRSASALTSSTSTCATPPSSGSPSATRDLHLAALEPRPALLPVDERLLEAERLAVERAAGVEVAHAVPDGHQSASAGLSTSCFSVRRKSAPTAPSIARWSQVSVIVISRHGGEAAVADDDALLARADREDRDLRRVEHGDELLDAEHAEVRDRERAALEVVLLQLVVARALHEVGARARDLGDAQPLGVADHGNDEPLRRGDGDADVRARVDRGSRRRRSAR